MGRRIWSEVGQMDRITTLFIVKDTKENVIKQTAPISVGRGCSWLASHIVTGFQFLVAIGTRYIGNIGTDIQDVGIKFK